STAVLGDLADVGNARPSRSEGRRRRSRRRRANKLKVYNILGEGLPPPIVRSLYVQNLLPSVPTSESDGAGALSPHTGPGRCGGDLFENFSFHSYRGRSS